MRGQFITLEGIEGVGKSTLAKFIQQYLESKNITTLLTREPGGTSIANQIRSLLLTETTEKMAQTTELLLMFAARAQHIAQLIEPSLKKGLWIICDRFTDASYAYQGYGRGLPLEQIAILEKIVQNDLQPNLTFILDAPLEIALTRMQQRGKLDRIESETTDFFERVRAGYLARAQTNPTRYKIIDASTKLETVQHQIQTILDNFIV